MEDWNMERDNEKSKTLKEAGQDRINDVDVRIHFQRKENQT